jgi:hypothetical protein
MTERPILFSAPMVRALLAGTKTQTRRVVKPQPLWIAEPSIPFKTLDADPKGIIRCPHGQPGDRLWVKETHWVDDEDGSVLYAANPDDWDLVEQNKHETGASRYNWKPSIFMPRKHSRITLEITGVRVERLQACNEVDAISEGAPWAACGAPQEGSHKAGFAQLWESINGPGSWEANPWVWVIEFKNLENQK